MDHCQTEQPIRKSEMDCSVHQRIKTIIRDTADKHAIHDPTNETPSTRNPYDEAISLLTVVGSTTSESLSA